MAKVIHKFAPDLDGFLKLPEGNVLSVCSQNNIPVVYLERNECHDDLVVQEVMFVGTGWTFNDNGYSFIGTVVTHNDSLVHHAYLKRIDNSTTNKQKQ